jgi:hypothetical protein
VMEVVMVLVVVVIIPVMFIIQGCCSGSGSPFSLSFLASAVCQVDACLVPISRAGLFFQAKVEISVSASYVLELALGSGTGNSTRTSIRTMGHKDSRQALGRVFDLDLQCNA